MSRVLARFQAPTFVPDPTRSKVSETVAYGVAREADTVLHQLQVRQHTLCHSRDTSLSFLSLFSFALRSEKTRRLPEEATK